MEARARARTKLTARRLVSVEIKIPDIGTANAVDVIAVMIKPGDTITVNTPLITLEGDKASMDVPYTTAGVVESVAIKVGDKVSEGAVICAVKSEASAPIAQKEAMVAAPQAPAPTPSSSLTPEDIHASPAVRRLARELSVDLTKIKPTGEK